MFYFALKLFVNFFAFINSLTLGNYQNLKFDDPPCFFNPLCACSKSYPDLGRVSCKDVPLLNVPQQINTSKIFMLTLENNGLRHLEPHFFGKTGIFKIEITQNLLNEIGEETFGGLERSLLELNLQRNKFRKIPHRALRYLKKLKFLDLSDNEITSIKPEDWMGLEDSLKNLILRGNKLSSLKSKTFSALRQLESLDLSENTLLELDNFAFKGDSAMQLKKLNLAGNLFSEIPLSQISELRELRHLDMSFNRIEEMKDFTSDRSKGSKTANLFLGTLRLDYNQIRHLPAFSFQHFPNLNRTYLNGNPIARVEREAFQRSKIRELYLGDCEISELTEDAFSGLESHLEILSLEGNNLTEVPKNFFKDFRRLKWLNLKNNFISTFDFDLIFDGHQISLGKLDVSDQLISNVMFRGWDKLNEIRSLAISKFSEKYLSSDVLQEHFSQLEEIKITKSNIKILRSHAFKHVRGLRRLDLSDNSISIVENGAFTEVAHSLVYLSFANGFSSGLTRLAHKIFEDLNSLEILDLSNNKLKNLPQKLFHSMKRLKIISLQDNFIEFIPKRAFQDHVHSELSTIQLSYNQLSLIESQTFEGLNSLESLWLNENRITKMETGAFTDLNRLRRIYLRGNEITFLNNETFRDLPELEKLDLAFNRLKKFNYNCLEQVGTLSSFVLNISFNQIEQIIESASVSDNLMSQQVNIKAFDSSHNNISFLGPRAFRPIESSVTHLYLSHNKLQNLTRDTFGNMMHLQWLDLSWNNLTGIQYEAFANTKSIQVLDFSNNHIQEIPKLLFRGFHSLRIVDLSNNELKTLRENLFRDGMVERLDVSNNHLNKVPLSSFYSDTSMTLSELDLSENAIASLPPPDAFAKFKNLHCLNLANNRLIRIKDGTFFHLSRLRMLDLSNNADLNLDWKGQIFYGLDEALENLILKNLSLKTMPNLHLSALEMLDLSENNIFTIPFEFPHNVTNLHSLELANNKLFSIPPAVSAFSKLEYLGISGNPLESINFQQSFTLREIDLRNISLDLLEKRALGKLPLLENLKVTLNQTIQDLNLPFLMKENHGLSSLHVEVLENGGFSLADEMNGWFPFKLRNLIIVGQGLKNVPRNLLQGAQSPVFNLILFNTSVEEIPKDVFHNAKQIRNLTLNVRDNKLQSMYNPNTGGGPNLAKKIFLTDLQISNNNWMCDCTIGWIEGWQRKKRQYLCKDNLEECLLASSDDIRSAVCANQEQKALSEVFKSELECEWNSSGKFRTSFILNLLVLKICFVHLL